MKLEDLPNELDRRHAEREERAESIQVARVNANRVYVTYLMIAGTKACDTAQA